MASTWESRFAEFIRRITGSRETTSLEVLRDLMPVAPVLDPHDVENYFVREEKVTSYALSRTAAAGNKPTISLVNDTVGMLLCVDALSVCVTTGNAEVVGELTTVASLGAVNDGGSGAKEFSDRRFKFTSEEPAGRIVQLDQAAAIPGIECFHVMMPATHTLIVPYRCVLVNGTALRIQAQTDASRLLVSIWGRERFPEMAERQ